MWVVTRDSMTGAVNEHECGIDSVMFARNRGEPYVAVGGYTWFRRVRLDGWSAWEEPGIDTVGKPWNLEKGRPR